MMMVKFTTNSKNVSDSAMKNMNEGMMEALSEITSEKIKIKEKEIWNKIKSKPYARFERESMYKLLTEGIEINTRKELNSYVFEKPAEIIKLLYEEALIETVLYSLMTKGKLMPIGSWRYISNVLIKLTDSSNAKIQIVINQIGGGNAIIYASIALMPFSGFIIMPTGLK